jgi:uncharacterized membrane protein (UPF0127 family)
LYAHGRSADPVAAEAYAGPGTGVTRPEQTFGPGPDTLLCDGRPVAPVAVAEDSATRGRGLLGTNAVVGALWITRCRSVHMVGMRYPIDVAVVDRDGVVLQVTTLRPWTGATWPRRGAFATIEAAAGALAEWGVRTGSRLAYERRFFVAP